MSTDQESAGVREGAPLDRGGGRQVGTRLNLCCGDRHWVGYENVDMQLPGMLEPDLDCDVRKLPYLPNTMEEISCIHGLEHFPRWEVVSILMHWRKILKPNGLLVLELPCLNMIIDILHEHPTPDGLPGVWHKLPDGRVVNKHIDAMNGLYGVQKHHDRNEEHKWCYTSAEIRDVLEAAGFTNILFKDPLFHRPFRDMRIEVRK